MAFESMEEWLRSSADKNISTAEAVIQEDMSDRGVSREETWTQMSRMWEAMRSSEQDYDRTLRSHSGLVGGNIVFAFLFLGTLFGLKLRLQFGALRCCHFRDIHG